MAGKNQHHVWQALQRGFGLLEFKEHHVWVYRRGVPPERTTTRLNGFEKYFYGERNSPADTSITLFERQIQGSLQDWRKMPNGAPIHTKQAAALVAHLEMRSQFIRDEATKKIGETVDFVKHSFSSPTTLKDLLKAYLSNNEEMSKNGVSPEMQKLAIDALESGLLDTSFRSGGAGLDLLKSIPGGESSSLSDIIAKSHNSTLVVDFFNAQRTESHQKLRYSILRPTDGSLILPDTCLSFFLKGGCSPMSQKNDQIESVVVPIAADCAIIGSNGAMIAKSTKTLNRSLASCAFEWFISPEESDDLKSLARRIGRNARLITKSKMSEVLSVGALTKGLSGS